MDVRKKNLRIVDCAQGSPEWYAARLGKVTASRISDVMATGRSGAPSATRAKYMAELVLERITGTRQEGFTSKAMRDGIEREAEACERYAFLTGVPLVEVGFVLHPHIDQSGASPDRLAGDDGLVQIKCPEAHTHMATLQGAGIDRAYLLQMQWEMACTSAYWCDFVSYHPAFPPSMRLCRRRVAREPAAIVEIDGAVRTFLSEVDRAVSDLTAKFELDAAE